MNIQQFIKQTFKNEINGYCIRPTIVCNDGFTMSVQGSSGHYCNPRNTSDYYISMEIGYPSAEEDLIWEYAENKQKLTETVYGWVPLDVIDAVIIKHGGINELETFKK